jgi:hypothetical protein
MMSAPSQSHNKAIIIKENTIEKATSAYAKSNKKPLNHNIKYVVLCNCFNAFIMN